MQQFLSILFNILIATCFVQAQEGYTLIRNIPGNYVSFSVDNLDNIYLLSNTNQLKKINEKGDSVAVFNDIKKFGEATLVDVSNPLKILLYYKNFATIVTLDRLLNPRNTTDLRKLNIFKADAVGLSYDGNIWLYDQVENVLQKVTEEGKLIFKTPDFRQLFDDVPNPQLIIDRNNLVYLYDSTRNIYMFDYYGAYKGKIPIQRWNNIRITDKYIYGNNAQWLYRYDFAAFKYDEWAIPAMFFGKRQFLYSNKILYVLDNDGLSLYQWLN